MLEHESLKSPGSSTLKSPQEKDITKQLSTLVFPSPIAAIIAMATNDSLQTVCVTINSETILQKSKNR